MLLSVCLCALLAYAQAQNAGQLKVNTTQGVVVGASAVDGDYYEFFGLHYGGSVSAENRFKVCLFLFECDKFAVCFVFLI